MRRVAVVINTRSGGLLGREDAAEEVAARLVAAGLEPVLVPEDAAPDLAGRLDRAVAEGAEAVLVGGGDGTVAAAAQRLAGTSTALGILPLGTMNMLAKDLGIPTGLEAAAEALASGRVRAIDVAEVNGHAFLCLSVLGLPTALGRHREQSRGGGPRALLRLAAAWTRSAWRHRPLRLAVSVDGAPPGRLRTRALAVANNAYAEGVGAFFARERIDRGELVLYRARGFGLWWAAKMAVAMGLGAWRDRPELDTRAARAVTIGSTRAALRVMNDGEALLLTPPLRYTIRPRALRVIVPAAPEPAPEAVPAEAIPAGLATA